ncbi:hypothetical protein FSP39_002342 [Pinctada imbricata]|uniref:Uncharacterized protein n=1 Tax=Pinctada imbricata TaxID=66713 RepID=A0AA89BJV0_PINIB|nr:hypothetical protein FSP39_002342 [Pinctada imbricata]
MGRKGQEEREKGRERREEGVGGVGKGSVKRREREEGRDGEMLVFIIISSAIGIILYKLVLFLMEWRRDIELCRKIPSIGPAHWFWGHINQFVFYIFQKFTSITDKVEKEREMIKNQGAKIFHTWLGPFHAIIGVLHPDAAKEIMKSTEPKPVFKDTDGYSFMKSWLGMGLLLSHGKKWERNRRLLTPAFHFDVLKPYVQIYNEVIDIFLNKIKMNQDKEKTVEMYDLVTLATLDTMLRCAFSYNGGIQTERYCSKKYTRAVKDDPEQLNRRRLDFLDILLSAKDDEGVGLSDEDIRAEVSTFLLAGHETTASAISWSFYYLGKYHDEQQKIYEEVQNTIDRTDFFTWENVSECRQLSLFVKESLRHTSPAPGFARYITKPFVLDGVEFPAGTTIGFCINHINNNPHIWPDYEVFRPERFLDTEARQRDPFAYVPFSAGSRYQISLVDGFEYEQDPLTVTKAKYGIKLHMEERK